jgi:hypothetical protein
MGTATAADDAVRSDARFNPRQYLIDKRRNAAGPTR